MLYWFLVLKLHTGTASLRYKPLKSREIYICVCVCSVPEKDKYKTSTNLLKHLCDHICFMSLPWIKLIGLFLSSCHLLNCLLVITLVFNLDFNLIQVKENLIRYLLCLWIEGRFCIHAALIKQASWFWMYLQMGNSTMEIFYAIMSLWPCVKYIII